MDNAELNTTRDYWELQSLINAKSPLFDIEGFLKDGKLSLHHIECDELGDIVGRSLLHLQCGFGLDTLSLARLGARAVGVDFAESAIQQAQLLRHYAKLDTRFICSDIYDLPKILQETFDIVFTSYGPLFWLADLKKWGELIAHFLKPGGFFYMVEYHPFANIFDEGALIDVEDINEDALIAPEMRFPYFRTKYKPLQISAKPMLEHRAAEFIWSFSVSDVLNALIAAGLRIEYIHEFDYMFLKKFAHMEQDKNEEKLWRWKYNHNQYNFPLLFSVRATL